MRIAAWANSRPLFASGDCTSAATQKRPFVLYELLIMQDLTSDETHNGNQLQASKQPRNYLAVACLLAYQLLDRRLAAGALRSYHKSDGCCDLRAYRQVLRLRTYAIPIEDEVRAPCRLPRGDGANGEIASTLFGLCFLLGDHETRNSNVPPTHGAGHGWTAGILWAN